MNTSFKIFGRAFIGGGSSTRRYKSIDQYHRPIVHLPSFCFDDSRRFALDNDHALQRDFKNEYWPALYFVDAQGRIRHHQFGEGEYEQ